MINTKMVENLFSSDFTYLQSFYTTINETGAGKVSATCPKCGCEFDVEISLGE
jgi:hypothetical protein